MTTTTTLSGYQDLDIYKISFDLSVRIYHLSIKLPHPDKFETGNQMRRSSQTIKDTIVEGYGRRRYKADLIKYLVYSHSSCLESTSQSKFLETIHPHTGWKENTMELNKLCIKIFNSIKHVETNWKT